MITEADIARINELYHKRKAGTISPEELKEHDELRQRYIAAMRESLRGHLDNTTLVYPDGRQVDLGAKYGKTAEKKEEN